MQILPEVTQVGGNDATMARNNGSRGRHGHIQPHERDTNDAVPIIGEDIEVTEEHKESVRMTLNNDRDEETQRNYRNHIKRDVHVPPVVFVELEAVLISVDIGPTKDVPISIATNPPIRFAIIV